MTINRRMFLGAAAGLGIGSLAGITAAVPAAALTTGRLAACPMPDEYQHPDKHDTAKLGYENSEDTLSWNVFRSFQEAGALAKLATEVFALPGTAEPELYLWGLKLSDDSLSLWPLLTAARRRFETKLPVDRPLTEPDIALHVPGRYLALIEAKFTSENNVYWAGQPREKDGDLTFEELLGIYWDPSLRTLDLAKARARERLHYQFWRNLVFAEWMSQHDSPATKAYHFNLVREGFEEDSAAEFQTLLHDGFRDRFRRVTGADDHRSSRRQKFSAAPWYVSGLGGTMATSRPRHV